MSILTFLARGTVILGMTCGVMSADLLNPLSPEPLNETNRIPLRAPEPAAVPAQRPKPRPAFEWRAGDRVVLLGDSLLEREMAMGFLETRLVTQNPDRDLQVRVIPWLTNHPLAGVATPGDQWLEDLRDELRFLKPTVVGLAFGNDLREKDAAAVAAFQTHLARLLDRITDGPADQRPRLLLFSPLGRPKPADGDTDAQSAEEFRRKLSEVVGTIATNRNAEFVNLHAWVRATEDFLERVSEGGTNRFPRLFDDREQLTAFGFYRATLALERSLQWRSSNWRFGYQSDGSLRDGGFGTRILDRSRTDQFVRVRHQEELLPTPNPEGFVDRTESTRPQCYIQLRGLASGMYALRVDGEEVQRAADYDWGRYQIIADGPSWKQAENLRQLIVKKNALFARRWAPGGEARSATGSTSDIQPFADPVVAEIEREIAKTRKPVARVYEVVRVGEAPKTETLFRIPPSQPSSASGESTIQVIPVK